MRNKMTRISKRVYVPSRRLRGFESGKIGPKEGSQYWGNYASALNKFNKYSIWKWRCGYNFFIDMANVWEVDYNSIGLNKIRSFQVSLNWYSPLGPLSLSYAIPLRGQNRQKILDFKLEHILMKKFFLIIVLFF